MPDGVAEPLLRAVPLALLLLLATIIDVRVRRIPNWLTGTGCLVALSAGAWAGGLTGFFSAGEGLLLAFAVGLPFWLLGWMGAGDVKLVAAVGAFVGPDRLPFTLVAIGVAGAFLATGALLWRGALGRTVERLRMSLGLTVASRQWTYLAPDDRERDVRLPYAVAISTGTLASILFFG